MTPRWWRWRRQAQAERRAAEERTLRVKADVIMPLRRMRSANHLTDAIRSEIARQHREGLL